MKTVKTTAKKTKKAAKPEYIVNLVDVKSGTEVYARFAEAKHNAGLPLTDEEMISIIDMAIEDFTNHLIDEGLICEENGALYPAEVVVCIKKEPWYKRLWNKITRKNK